MKKILLIVILILITGCVNYVELADIEVIENLAIDYQDNKYKILVTTVIKDEEKKYEVKESYGSTLNDAILNLKMKENKKIYIAHLNLLLLTEDVVDYNLEDVIKFFLNNSESRNDFDVALIKDINILEDSTDIRSQIQIIEEDLATTKSILFEELLSNLLEEKSTYLPIILENDKVEGISIVRNYKDRINISKEECILYNFFDGEVKQTVFKETPISSSVTTYSFKDGVFTLEIIITTSGGNARINKELEKSIRDMFLKYKDMGVDIFDIENKICNKNRKYCEKHDYSIIDDITFKINVKLESEFSNDMEVSLK